MLLNHSTNMTPPVPIFQRPGLFTVELEVRDNHPFLHLQIEKFTPSVYKELIVNYETVQYFLGCMGYPYVFGALSKPVDPKLIRLYGRLGLDIIVDNEDIVVFIMDTDISERE